MYETRAELIERLREIEKWENDQKGLWFWEKIGRLPFVMLDKLTPKFVHKKIGQVLDELGSFIQTGGQYLVDENKVVHQFFGEEVSQLTLEERASLPLTKMDEAASKLAENRAKTAMVQGGTTGIGGLFTLAIDIPFLLGLTLKTIQEIGICYGFDPKEKRERIFVVKCLQFASADIVGKKAILEELSMFHEEISHSQMMSQLQGWREVLLTYRDNFGWKKLFQMVPIAGIIFGAWINKSAIEDSAEVARMLYAKRRVVERLNQLAKNACTDNDTSMNVKEIEEE